MPVSKHIAGKVYNRCENDLLWKYKDMSQGPRGRACQELVRESAHQVDPLCGGCWESGMEEPWWPPLFWNIQGRQTRAGKVISCSS